MHRWKDACELRVWEKGHVSRAPSDLKGKSPSKHIDQDWPQCWVTMGRQVVPGLCAEPVSGDPQMVWSCDPWNPQPVREMEIGWEAGLRKGH